jgi:hypothetical protein
VTVTSRCQHAAVKATATLDRVIDPQGLLKVAQPFLGLSQRRLKHLDNDKTAIAKAETDKVGSEGKTIAKVETDKVDNAATDHNKSRHLWKRHGHGSSIMTSSTMLLSPLVKERCCYAAWSQKQALSPS